MLCLYGVMHGLLRMVLTSSIGQDDVIANLYVQTLEWGYNKRQPPLYEWLLWAVQQFTGPTLVSFLIVKYVLLTVMGVFVYASARQITGSAKWAALSVFSLSLCYQIGQNVHEGVTHTLVLSCAIAATFWAFLRLCERGRITDYLIFGLCIGVGFLGKYGFVAFLVTLFGAALLQQPLRARLSLRGLGLSLLVGAIVMAPFALWLLDVDKSLSAISGSGMRQSGLGYFGSLLKGLPPAIYAPFEFVTPLIIILPLFFTGMIGAVRNAGLFERGGGGGEPDYERLLLNMFLIACVLLVALVIFFSFTRILARYMHPFALTFVIWLVAQARRGESGPGQVRRYCICMISFAVVVFGWRAVNLVVADPICNSCRQLVPYEPVAEALKAHGFKHGLIITMDRHTGGNMRRLFQDDWVAGLNNPVYIPPKDAVGAVSQIAVVWSSSAKDAKLPPKAMSLVEAYGFEAEGDVVALRVPWSHAWRETGYRHTDWRFVILPAKR